MAWTKIPNYDGFYEINEQGQIRSNYFSPPKIMTASLDKDGYLIIGLVKNGIRKTHKVHRLVLETFSPVENADLMTVNHKDENKQNNTLSNLEWLSQKDNCNYGTRNIRCAKGKGKKIIDTYTGQIYDSIKQASIELHFDSSYIVKVCKHKIKTQGQYRWEYYEGETNGS